MHAGRLACEHGADDLSDEIPELGDVHQEVLGDLEEAAQAAKEHFLGDHPLREQIRHQPAGLGASLRGPLNNL